MNKVVPWIVMGISLPLFMVAFAAVTWFTNEWILGTLATATLLAWLCGWLVIAYGQGTVRAAAIGAVVAGGAYWLLALGPWFQLNIGSTLLTSRLLAWVEATHRQPAQAVTPSAAFTTLDLRSYVAPNTVVAGSGAIPASQYLVTTIPPTPQSPVPMSHFQSAGHWSFAWLLALAGGALAASLRRRTGDEECPP